MEFLIVLLILGIVVALFHPRGLARFLDPNRLGARTTARPKFRPKRSTALPAKRTSRLAGRTPRPLGAPRPAFRGFDRAQISQNDNAVCWLTGLPAKECSCAKHPARKDKNRG
jgi:hypothetical protein